VSNHDIASYVIGWDIPSSQQSMFKFIGNSAYYNTQDAAVLGSYFYHVGQKISTPLISDYIFGYCSPSRSGMIDTLYVPIARFFLHQLTEKISA
jgi:hypothetical protein